MKLVVPNTNGYITSAYGATLAFAAYGSTAGTLRVDVTGSSAGSFSQSIAYTTTQTYYFLPFTSNGDTQFTIYLGGSSPGTAAAEIAPETVYVTDFSMYAGAVSNNLEGSLSLLNGVLTAPTINSTAVMNAYYLDVTNEFLTNPSATSYFCLLYTSPSPRDS